MDQCETNENTQLAITTKGFSAVCSVRLILAIYHIDNLSGGHFLSPEDQNKLLAKLDKQKSELDESEELFEIEEAKYKKYASDWS